MSAFTLPEGKELVLASASPRRRDILNDHGVYPIIMPAEVDETLPEVISAESAVLYLSLKKALRAEEILLENTSVGANDIDGFSAPPLILAADTLVYHERLGIVGKPESYEEAFHILKTLCGSVHEVVTGVTLLEAGRTRRCCFYERSLVKFRKYGDKAIRDYIDSGEPFDRAGAYAIQGAFGKKYVEDFEGDFENIVGLPWRRVEAEISRLLA